MNYKEEYLKLKEIHNNSFALTLEKVVDTLNIKYVNENNSDFAVFSHVDSTYVQSIIFSGEIVLWCSEDGDYFYSNEEESIELTGQDLQTAMICFCEEKYKSIITQLYNDIK